MKLASLAAVLVSTAFTLALAGPSAASATSPASPVATHDTARAAETAAPPGRITVEFGRFERANRPLSRLVRRTKAAWRVVREVNELVVVPRTIPILFSDVLAVGPAFLPEVTLTDGRRTTLIHYPGSFLRLSVDVLRRELRGVKALRPRRAMTLVTQFVIAHEIGHALVHELRLPVTGREEDAVDGFAAYLLADNPRFGPASAIAAAMLFEGFASDPRKLTSEHFADEHSLAQQRVYQFVCWVYGSHPKRFRGLVGPDLLPRKRAVRCRSEWRQLRSSWDQILAPHLRAGTR